MAARSLHGLLPSHIALPVTPMLDVSFQLLFFFICIYQPPATTEGQFIVHLHVPPPPPPPNPSSGSDNQGRPNPFVQPPIPNDLTIDVYTHIGTNDRGVAELLIEKIKVSGGLAEPARKNLQKLGLIEDTRQGVVEITGPPSGSGEADAKKVTPQSEKNILEQLAVVLREHHASLPDGASMPILTIIAPRELSMSKIVSLMDYGNENGFALALKVTTR